MKRLLILVLLLLAVAGCRKDRHPAVAALYGGKTAALRRATVVEVYRVETQPAKIAGDAGEQLYGHEVLDGPEVSPPGMAKKLGRIFLDHASYQWTPLPELKLCGFEPAVMARFEHGPDRIDIMISFVCERIRIYYNAGLLGEKDISPAHNKLLKIVKPLFPDDNYLQLLQKNDQ